LNQAAILSKQHINNELDHCYSCRHYHHHRKTKNAHFLTDYESVYLHRKQRSICQKTVEGLPAGKRQRVKKPQALRSPPVGDKLPKPPLKNRTLTERHK